MAMNDRIHPAEFEASEEVDVESAKIEKFYEGQVCDDPDDLVSNTSGNRTFEDILQSQASRRAVMAGGFGAAAATFFAPELAEANWWRRSYRRARQLIGFEELSNSQIAEEIAEGNTGHTPIISDDYEFSTMIPWGERLQPETGFRRDPFKGRESNRDYVNENQADLIGIGHDGMWFFPHEYDYRSNGDYYRYAKKYWSGWRRKRCTDGMLAINHEFGRNSHIFGKDAPVTAEEVKASQEAHGVSVVRVRERRNGQWRQARSSNARRIHVNTPVTFSGPVADSPLLENPAGNSPLGTVNNCANGYTPWGTYLTCEENFNGYFGAKPQKNSNGTYVRDDDGDIVYEDFAGGDTDNRYGFFNSGFGYVWQEFDDRFDLNNPDYANERNRFGWVVEIDPMNGRQIPVKRTALGRMKHEGVAVTEGKGGRVVCYMGDDERFDYIYKYVSNRSWRREMRQGNSPLDNGKLYVARFNEDNSGDWLELTIDNPVLADRFSSQAEVLTYARVAADLLGATPMDRPEWTTVAPNGWVYCTLTNNSRRTEEQTDAANPKGPNRWGHIIRWKDTKKFTGTTFKWDIFLFGEDSIETDYTFGSPDGIWADDHGRIFIATDGTQPDTEDGASIDGLQDQLLVADPKKGTVKRLLMGVSSDEITGITTTPCGTTMFVNTQHPGNGNPEATSFPKEYDGVSIPRDCTIVIRKKDGGVIGS